MSELCYLASPYSAATQNMRTRRFKQVCKMAAKLMSDGHLVFCPIAHSHPIERIGMPTLQSGDWWLKQDFAVLEFCDKLVVYRMPGWDKSYGVGKEIEFAKRHNIPIEYLDE